MLHLRSFFVHVVILSSKVRALFFNGDQLLLFVFGVDLPEVGVRGSCLPELSSAWELLARKLVSEVALSAPSCTAVIGSFASFFVIVVLSRTLGCTWAKSLGICFVEASVLLVVLKVALYLTIEVPKEVLTGVEVAFCPTKGVSFFFVEGANVIFVVLCCFNFPNIFWPENDELKSCVLPDGTLSIDLVAMSSKLLFLAEVELEVIG